MGLDRQVLYRRSVLVNSLCLLIAWMLDTATVVKCVCSQVKVESHIMIVRPIMHLIWASRLIGPSGS